jgi:uroporphyrinogen-III decarboxylase
MNPLIQKSMDAMFEAGKIASEWLGLFIPFMMKMAELGFPSLSGATAVTPFDNLSMILRGSRGAMIDMYRQPEKVHAAMHKIQMLNMPGVIALAHQTRNPRVNVFTYRGSDGFLSLEQFEEFYWPGTKELILALIDEGLTPVVHFEGVWDKRLKYLTDLPAGKILGVFERTDLMKLKDALTGKMCFTGGMPISLIQTGTPEEIRAHTKDSINKLAADGGYIMAASTSFTDQVPEENMRSWIEATKEYGVY